MRCERESTGWPERAPVGDRRPRRPAPGPRAWARSPRSTGVTLVPDRRDDGTNVLRLPAGSRLPLRLRPGLVPGPPGRGDAARPRRACPARPGPGLRRRLAGRRRRARPALVADPGRGTGGPKAPGLTLFPSGTKRSAPLAGARRWRTAFLAVRRASWPPCGPEPASWPRLRRFGSPLLGGLLGRCPLLGGLASRSPLRPPSSPGPLLGRPCLAGARFGRLLGRSPLLGSLA